MCVCVCVTTNVILVKDLKMNNSVNPLRWLFALFFDISDYSTTVNTTQKQNVYYSKSLDPYPDSIGYFLSDRPKQISTALIFIWRS